jgi:hypothetical protein
VYRPFEAHRQATARRPRHHPRRIDTSAELGQLVAELLAQRWSPQQISRHRRSAFRQMRTAGAFPATGTGASWTLDDGITGEFVSLVRAAAEVHDQLP